MSWRKPHLPASAKCHPSQAAPARRLQPAGCRSGQLKLGLAGSGPPVACRLLHSKGQRQQVSFGSRPRRWQAVLCTLSLLLLLLLPCRSAAGGMEACLHRAPATAATRRCAGGLESSISTAAFYICNKPALVMNGEFAPAHADDGRHATIDRQDGCRGGTEGRAANHMGIHGGDGSSCLARCAAAQSIPAPAPASAHMRVVA